MLGAIRATFFVSSGVGCWVARWLASPRLRAELLSGALLVAFDVRRKTVRLRHVGCYQSHVFRLLGRGLLGRAMACVATLTRRATFGRTSRSFRREEEDRSTSPCWVLSEPRFSSPRAWAAGSRDGLRRHAYAQSYFRAHFS